MGRNDGRDDRDDDQGFSPVISLFVPFERLGVNAAASRPRVLREDGLAENTEIPSLRRRPTIASPDTGTTRAADFVVAACFVDRHGLACLDLEDLTDAH